MFRFLQLHPGRLMKAYETACWAVYESVARITDDKFVNVEFQHVQLTGKEEKVL